ncbi:MAG: glycosyltransferase [Bacillaceae bacterium]|nr:glycosyltransferase [Bacillaceae bacterium]
MIIAVINLLLIFFIWNIVNTRYLPRLPKRAKLEEQLLCSILVPLRNEERNVKGLVQSLQKLQYPHLEFILLDDRSEDDTLDRLKQETAGDSRFRLIEGNNLPEGWVGKVFACYQLSGYAKGDFLLFLDADARLQPEAIGAALTLMKKKDAKLLTGFPVFPVSSWLGALLIPMQHFVVYFHLPLMLVGKTLFPSAVAAHGAFMFFERRAYEVIGGHKSVRSSLVEDVHLARKMKEHGHQVVLANVTEQVTCRMYETSTEVWQGFLKNIYAGLGRSPWLVVMLSGFYGLFYVWPLYWLFYGLITLQMVYVLPFVLGVLQRLWTDWISRQRKIYSLLMPLSALTLIVLMHASMWRSLRKRTYQWKGRYYS